MSERERLVLAEKVRFGASERKECISTLRHRVAV